MRIARALAVTALIAFVVVLGSSGGHAQGPATVFLGIGDLADGGANSIVQEATQVGSTIYAVGASTRTATGTIPSLDTAVTWDSVTNALVIVPDLAVFNPLPTNANSVIYAVTPDALYMAGRLRSDASNISLSNGFKALRTLGGLRTVGAFTALDISDSPLNPNIVYGQQSGGAGAPAGVNNSRAIRFDTSGPSNTAVQVPLLTTNLAGGCVLLGSNPVPPPPQTCLDNLPAYRGMSSDGSVLVGTAFTGLFQGGQNQYLTTNGLAFRWDVVNQPNAVTEIPRPTGGTWSSAIAVSTNGNLTLAGGNSNDYPLGEVWIHNATTDAIQELGSPNTQFTPRLFGGMTADGSVVGVTFMGSGPTQSPTFANNPTQYAYLHNSHGWFHLANVLTAQGVNLWGTAASPGWDPANMILTGIRTVDTDNNGTADVDLVFGQGRRRNLNGSAGAPEGFVASFPVGVLAAYQLPAPAPVANNALVGAWALGSDPNNPLSVMVLLADGTYYTTMSRNRALTAGYGTGAGNFERGVYTLTGGNAVTFTTTEDRDGAGPHQSGSTPATFVFNGQVSSLNGRQSLSVNFTSADTFTVEDATCSPVCSVFQGTRITGASGSIAGAWTANNPPFFPDGRFIIVLLNSNAGSKYYEIADGTLENQNDGGEGTYVWDANLHQFTLTPSDGGSPDVVDASPTSDELGLFINDPPDSFTLTRIVNPDTVLPSITNATLAAKGSPGAAFSYTVTAVKAVTFGATDLPAGLTIDASSGVISGTTAQSGVFNVQVTATNTLGDTDTETLVLTFTDAPAAFHGIGDLPTGAVGSAVRDATRVNGNLYAVGASSARDIVFCTSPNVPSGCLNAGSTFPNLDSPVWWRWTGSGAGTLAALPEVPVHDPLLAPTNQIFAYAITPDARYIAGQAHFTANSTGTQWVRDTNVGGTLSILSVGANIPQVAYAMSDDGATVYGTRSSIGARIDIVGTGAPGTTVTVTTPLPLPAGTTVSQPVARGTSSNGAVMVGVASNGTLAATNGIAFRYTKATNTIGVIPMLMGGTWNYPVAVSASGAQTVVAGNSSDFPNGEVYLTDSANAITATLGSPNDLLVPKMLGGITADGAIAVTFGTGGNNPSVIPTGGRYAYIHNSHGWFSLSSVLAAQNIDLVVEDWDPTNMLVTGVRTVEGVDLVFGQGRRRSVGAAGYVSGAQEGFVVELPSGTLAAFNPQPAAPTDQSIVGTWLIGTDPANPTSVLSTFADGTFIRINLNLANGGPNGIERGLYSWAGNAAGGAYATTTLYDTDGTFGNSGTNGFLGRTVIVTGDTLTLTDTNCPGCTVTAFQRVAASAGSIVGGWVGPYPPTADSFVMAVFTGATGGNKYYFGTHGPDWGGDDVENGTFTWDAGTHTLLTVNSGGVPDSDPTTATLAHDELGLQIAVTYPGPVVETFDLTRIVAPSTVTPTITNATLAASGAKGSAFSYTVTATRAIAFGAAGLPPGLSIDPVTGVISGTPTINGIFSVTITATNTLGSTDVDTLVLSFGPGAIFHGIGDLPGGALPGSAVRDATRVNGTLYAVGASSQRTQTNLCNNFTANDPVAGCITFPTLDTPVLWTDTGTGTPSLVPLPEAMHNPATAPTNGMTAHALTPGAQYIASQYHATANSTNQFWVRVANAGGTLTNQAGGSGSITWAIADDGSVLYGQRSVSGLNRATRHVFSGATATVTDVPLPTGVSTTISQPAPHGTTTDGSVMVGVASNGSLIKSNGVAFRYSQATGVSTPIPMLPAGGTWNYPLAVSGTGAVTLMAGNSTAHPNGEIYLTDAAGAVIGSPLGSPSEALSPYVLGGMTQDGNVVAVTFATLGATNNPAVLPNGSRYAYIHNSHGWFHLSSVLAAQGVNLVAANWDPTNMAVTGVRTIDGVDLVFGEGRRRVPGPTGYVSGAQEGFVVELPAGTLAAFNPQPVAPTDQSIVGTWLVGTDPANPTSVLSNFADGTFIRINLNLANGGPNGIERGLYSWAGNAAGGAYATTTLYDTDGTFGASGANGGLGRSVIVTGDTLTVTDTNCPGCTVTVLPRVAASAGSIVGGWVGPYPPTADSFVMAVFTGATGGNKYYFGTHGPDWGGDDVENGTFTWDAGTHTLLTVNSGGVPDSDPTTATLAHDELGLQIAVTYPGPVVETFDLTRVVAPSTVTPQLTPPAQVNALVNAPFSYVVPSTHARTFAASGLPDGLSLNTATGEISGTPTTLGISTVNVTATNTFGSPGAASFDINAMGTPVITSPLTLSASIDVPFSYTVTATHSPTTFGATGLPAGLSIDTATGAITGTPTEFGIFNVGLSATNPVATGNATLVLTITAVPGITSALSVSGTIDVPFTYTITATRTPTLFGATGLPAGLSLNTATGEITGTPTEFGVFTVGLTAANSVSEGGATLNLTITAVPVVTSLLTLSAPIDVPFSYTVTATHSPTTFGATGLPAGLAINTSTGAITGTPTEFGVFTVNLTVANSVSEGSATLDLTITAVPVFTSSLFVTTPADAAFAYAITATYSPTTFSATGLPPGLGIDTNTGAITGTPTTPGYFPVAISAANSISTGYATLNLTISSVAPTGTGSNVTVTPEVPAGTPEVSLQFETVSGGGETSVALIAPEVIEALPELPPNLLQVEVGGQSLVYQIETTATVSGPVDICFTYPPDAFVGETPRLLHFDHNALPEPGQWIDVTSSVDEANNVICGTVESFSPFVIVKTETPTPFLGTTSIAITFEGGPYVYRGSAFTATAVATSDDGFSQSVPVIYTGDCLNASLTGCTATATFAGITTPGVGSYSGSTDSAKIFISKVPSSTVVTFEPGPYTYRGSAFTATAHVTGVGLDTSVPVSYGGNCLNVTGPDGCTASASFAGDRNHTGSNGGASITIQKAPATVTLSNMTQTFTSGSLAPTVTTTPLGLSYTLIGAPQIGPGSFTVTATITAANYSGSASGTFVIASTTPLTANVISPNGLEQRFIGVPTTIRWNVTGATSIDVALSRDGGHNYTNIAGCTGLPGSATSCAWTPTGPATIMTKVRVTARGAGNTTAISASALPFILTSGSPSVKVQLPTGQATWAIGTTKPIAWTHNLGANAAFRIELSRNNGGTWETLAASADGALLVLGGFPWEVTGPTTANAKIRITSLDSPASNTSSTFAIVSPAVTVTVPNANVSWSRNSQKTITWNHNLGTGTSIKVELSRDGGTTWTTLAASVANSGATTGSYNWTVAGPTTTTARIRVSWTTDANVKDTSDVNFKIQ